MPRKTSSSQTAASASNRSKRVPSLQARLADLHEARVTVQRQAERYLRAYYRVHRRVRWGPLTALVGMPKIQQLIFWGELEHLLCVATALRRLHRLWSRIAATSKRIRRDG